MPSLQVQLYHMSALFKKCVASVLLALTPIGIHLVSWSISLVGYEALLLFKWEQKSTTCNSAEVAALWHDKSND